MARLRRFNFVVVAKANNLHVLNKNREMKSYRLQVIGGRPEASRSMRGQVEVQGNLNGGLNQC